MKYSLVSIFLLCMFAFITPAHAQFNQMPEADISVNMTPENPGPNQLVNVSVVSYITDINSANIVWQINGKTEKNGRGEKTFNFTTGDINTTTTLRITILTAEGESIEKIFKIKPIAVDLMWESDSFVPPFYKGKSMFSHQSPITFIAIPHMINSSGQEIGAKNLVYKWIKNGSVMEADSGYGKNTYSMVGSLISRRVEMRVEISSPTTSGVGIGILSVDPIEPFVIFYKKNPLYGIEFQKALVNTVELKDSKEILVIGVPFFFGTKNQSAPELLYKWSINGNPISSSQSGPAQVFRQKEGTSGTSMISLSVEHADKILEVASNNFNLKFENVTANTSGV